MHKQKDYFYILFKTSSWIECFNTKGLTASMAYPSSSVLEESRLFKMYFLCTGSNIIVSKTSKRN